MGGCVNSLIEHVSGSRECKGMSGDNRGLIMFSEQVVWCSELQELEKEERGILDHFSEQIKLHD